MSEQNGRNKHYNPLIIGAVTTEDLQEMVEVMSSALSFVILCVERLGLTTPEQIHAQSKHKDDGTQIPLHIVEHTLNFYLMIEHSFVDQGMLPARDVPSSPPKPHTNKYGFPMDGTWPKGDTHD